MIWANCLRNLNSILRKRTENLELEFQVCGFFKVDFDGEETIYRKKEMKDVIKLLPDSVANQIAAGRLSSARPR